MPAMFGPRGPAWMRRGLSAGPFSTFEKAILANSGIILLVTVAGWWITQHNPETYHYLIDTAFIAAAAVGALFVNYLLMRAAFRPLHTVLRTMRAVEEGDLTARATADEKDMDALAFARGINAMLDRLEGARDETAARVLRAAEAERRRIALELHDQTGQSLTALTLHAQTIVQGLEDASPRGIERARRQAERLSELAQRTLEEVQALSRQLRPPMLDELGLAAALRWLGDDASQRLGAEVRVAARLRARLPREAETALYRIAQESVTNAVRHGRARHIRICLRERDRRIVLLVADDGGGFDPATAAARRRDGLGLEGMRERARLAGGTLRVRSGPGRGCVVAATVPATSPLAGDAVEPPITPAVAAAHPSVA